MIYRVKNGDTLSEIARDHGVSMAELARLNGIGNADIIYIGQLLDIPVKDPEPVKPEPAPVQPDPEPDDLGVSYADIGRAVVRFLAAAEKTDEFAILSKLLNG